jgi:H+/Cl- antiporter ClcA
MQKTLISGWLKRLLLVSLLSLGLAAVLGTTATAYAAVHQSKQSLISAHAGSAQTALVTNRKKYSSSSSSLPPGCAVPLMIIFGIIIVVSFGMRIYRWMNGISDPEPSYHRHSNWSSSSSYSSDSGSSGWGSDFGSSDSSSSDSGSGSDF